MSYEGLRTLPLDLPRTALWLGTLVTFVVTLGRRTFKQHGKRDRKTWADRGLGLCTAVQIAVRGQETHGRIGCGDGCSDCCSAEAQVRE